MDWFLYDIGLRHERIKVKQKAFFIIFRGPAGANDCLRHERAPLTLETIQSSFIKTCFIEIIN